jgi:hypothetical protein
MRLNVRTLIMVVTAILAAITVVWLQSRFEHGDERNALGLVQSYRSKAGVSIPQVLSRRHPDRAAKWSTATESSCFQHIRVHAVIYPEPGSEPLVYAFTVDINGPSIHPANKQGEELMAALDTPLPPAASASASVSASVSASAAALEVAP